MQKPSTSSPSTSAASAPTPLGWRRVLNLGFYGLGVWFFIILIQHSEVTWDLFSQIGWMPVLWLITVYSLVTVFDVYAWYFVSGGEHHVGHLLNLRVAGEAITNAVPGGVVFGEGYKASKLKQWYGVPLSRSTPRLLLLKLGLGYSQSIFVLLGLLLCFPLLAERSMATAGFPGLQWAVLAAIIAMGFFMGLPALQLARGKSFTAFGSTLEKSRFSRLTAWATAKREVFARFDADFVTTLRHDRKQAAQMFAFLCLRWLASVPETYLLLYVLGLEPTWGQAIVIESLGSMFRLIFFIVPSGVGGQDASFFALFSLYGLPAAEAAVFVILKRTKELFWVGLGFGLIALSRLTDGRRAAVTILHREP